MYRRSLSYRSGAGQLIAMQVRGLRQAGSTVRLYCQRGALRYLMQSGLRAHRVGARAMSRLERAPAAVVVDHEMALPQADVVFSHNLMSAALKYLPRGQYAEQAARERDFFSRLRSDALIVANSELVRSELIGQFELAPERVLVCYPGFRAAAFDPARRDTLRRRGRHALGLGESEPLVGFVTSGDLPKRGIDVFLAAATEIAQAVPGVHFLVVGSKRLPEWARRHPLVAQRRLHHRPRGSAPATWMAALDVFLYPARFEEFGMVVLEASALGVPVLTSRRVGASECLPEEFGRWLSDEPESEAFASRTIALLEDAEEMRMLSSVARSKAAEFDDARFVRESIALIHRQKR